MQHWLHKYDSFYECKIVLIRKNAKFRAYSKIGISLKIPTCKYNGFKFSKFPTS